jgi:hypothetical protein
MPSYWIDYVIANDFKNIDLLVLSNVKQFNDITSTVESVTINNQNYFAEIYLDAGYIGSNTYIYSKAIVRTTTDITKLNDSGIINKQNYAISNYAVPGYAGINIVY